MNKKEINEIRKRFRAERNNIDHIYGCYVNSNNEIVAKIDESVSLMGLDSQEKYLSLFKKSLSGALCKNLIDISFSTSQVVNSEEHALLASLRRTKLKDEIVLDEFFRKIISSVSMEENYLILAAYDVFDIPNKTDSPEEFMESTEMFRYFICCVCPVKSSDPVLRYKSEENRFFNQSLSQIVGNPEFGFMFPAFDDRRENIYGALFYTKNSKDVHGEFIENLFKTQTPLSAIQQRNIFAEALNDSLNTECNLDIFNSINEKMRERISIHKESKDPNVLYIEPEEISEILEENGISQEKCDQFVDQCKTGFGDGHDLPVENIINYNRSVFKTDTVKLSISPDMAPLVRSEEIDGKKYLLVPIEGTVEINGINYTA